MKPYPPRELIEKEFIPLITNCSRNYLYAKLKEYDGNIRSYETVTKPLGSALSALVASDKEERVYHDIQNELGELNKTYQTYELFIGSNFYKSYKYRIMFVRYGQAGYPATVVLAEAIAREVQIPVTLEKSYIYRIDSMLAMKNLLLKIMDTEAFFAVMQEAINSSIIEEQRIEKQRIEDAQAIKQIINN